MPDLNGDKYPEVIVGSTREHIGDELWEKDTGRVYLLSGSDGSILRSFDGEGKGDRFGDNVDWVPDANGDGIPDILVASLWAFSCQQRGQVGKVYLYSGANGNLLWTKEGWMPSIGSNPIGFGVAAHGITDVNADGLGDVAVITTKGNTPEVPQLFMYSGMDGSLIWQVEGFFISQLFGGSGGMDTISDLNGDGIADVVAAERIDPENYGIGVSAFSGIDGLDLWNSSSLSILFTYSLVSVPDISGDGIQDIVLGTSHETLDEVVIAVSGSDGQQLWITDEPTGYSLSNFGVSVTSIKDITGDGKPEILAGDTQAQGGAKVYVLDGTNGNIIDTMAPPDGCSYCKIGASVSGFLKWQ